MQDDDLTLAHLGWGPTFASQIDSTVDQPFQAVRVMAVHRGWLSVTAPDLDQLIPTPPQSDDEKDQPTVGDWVLVNTALGKVERVLDRKSLFKRRAPGSDRRIQLIAANVDTLFIVSSCNQDFNAARLERYLALAKNADVLPIVILTKADLTSEPEVFVQQASRLAPGLLVEPVDARDTRDVDRLAGWCASGQTVALVGSSGVGKSTLVATLTGNDTLATQGTRASDDKGRHTTTARSLHRLARGGWLLDTPGMRELQLNDAADGLDALFSDILQLAAQCKFSDCRHESEPGCAIRNAITDGVLEAKRVERWKKLASEERRNSESIAQRRSRDRAFSKRVRKIVSEQNARKRGWD